MSALPPPPLGQPALCPMALDCQKFCLDLALSSWNNVSIPFSPPISPELISGLVPPDMYSCALDKVPLLGGISDQVKNLWVR